MSVIFITGGHGGLGLECVKSLAKQGNVHLILAGRDQAKVEKIAHELRQDTKIQVDCVKIDLSSLVSVREGALQCKKILNDQNLQIDALLLNAGVQINGPLTFSHEGYEETFATNCLGHFLLLNLLLDQVKETGRVIFTASGTHDPVSMDGKFVGVAAEPNAIMLANEGKKETHLTGGQRYTSSKLCDILYSYELARRLLLNHSKITSLAFDPGFIPETELSKSAPQFIQKVLRSKWMKSFMSLIGVTMGDLKFSGESLAKLALDPQLANSTGKYYQSNHLKLIERKSSVASYDQYSAKKLWIDSENLVHLEPDEEPKILQIV